MADKKISELTAATTPLAGTEVLPIVQSGSTVKVSIADVTAGRAVSATSISAGLGAAGTPAYTFTGDTDTGMWSPAANTIAFSEGGVEAMRITDAGRVGIGTSAPATTLHLSSAQPIITLTDTDTGANARISAEGSIGGLTIAADVGNTVANSAIFFSVDNTERMRITDAGFLLLATTTPSSSSTADGFVVSGTNGALVSRRASGAAQNHASFVNNGVTVGTIVTSTTATTYNTSSTSGITGVDADTVAIRTASAERMRLDASGNVGIGTSVPANRLAVQNDTAPTFFDTTLDNTAMLICVRGAGLNNFGASLGFSRLDSSGRVNAAIAIKQTSADGDQCGLSFFTHSSASTGASLLEAMSITHAGNVGIGITAPRSILSAASATGSVLTLESTDTTLTTNDVVGEIDFYANDGSTNGTGVKASVRAFANDATGNNIALAFATSDGTTLAADRMILDGQGRLGIGTTTPDAAARLDVSSTTSGFLPPRMTEAQRDLIATPPDGLMLYNSTTNKLQVRAAGSWVDLH
jgi:hypothetical protein